MKKSKKILLLFIGLFLLNIGIVKAETNIGITSAIVKEKSSTITVEEPVVSGSDITSNVTFNEVNDYVIFEITLKNNESDKYKIKSISDNNTNTNLEVEYDYSEDFIESGSTSKIKVKLTYKNQLTNQNVSLNNLTITLSLEKEDGSESEIIINPTTGDNILHYLVLLIIALTGLILIKVKKKIKTGALLIVIGLALVPFAVIAKEEYKVNFRFTNIEIKGTFEQYNVTIDLGDGSDPIVRTITYGDPIGELPEAPEKAGHTFSKWVDGSGNEVTSETIVSGEMTITPEYTTDKHTLTITHPEYITEGDLSGEYEYGTEIILTAKAREGFTFSKWSNDSTDNPITIIIGDDDITIEPIYNQNLSSTFKKGTDVNAAMKKLANPSNPNIDAYYSDSNIRYIEKSTVEPDLNQMTEANIISTDDSEVPIYIWWDDSSKTIYWWSEANKIYLNEASSELFNRFAYLKNVDVEEFDTSKVNNMAGMFSFDTFLEELDLTKWDTSNVIIMNRLFYRCSNLTSLDLSSFDTSNVIRMDEAFGYCSSLQELDVSTWDTSNVLNMVSMFSNCGMLEELDLSSFDTRRLTNMYGMFLNITNMKRIIVSDRFDVSALYYNTSDTVFSNAYNLVGGAGTHYSDDDPYSYPRSNHYARIDGGENNPGYFTSNLNTILFNPNGGSVRTESKNIPLDKKGGSLPIPYREGYNFVGWYTESEGGNEITSDTVITSSFTVYAHWVEKTSSELIEYYDNGDNKVGIDDIVKLGDDIFYVVGTTKEGNIKLLAAYNLDSNYRQSMDNYEEMSFSDDSYWDGSAMTTTVGDEEWQVLDDYSKDSFDQYNIYRTKNNDETGNSLYPYVNNYKEHLINDVGINEIVDARILTYEEINNVCTMDSVTNKRTCPEYASNQSYWLGTLTNDYNSSIYFVSGEGDIINYGSHYNLGARPLIIISGDIVDEKYTVTFDTNGKVDIGKIIFIKDADDNIVDLPNIKAYDEVFDGWYEDNEYTTKLGSSIKVNEDTTVYAKFTSCNHFASDSWSNINSKVVEDPSYYPVGCERKIKQSDFSSNTVRVANNTTPEICNTTGFSQTACGFVLEYIDPVNAYYLYDYLPQELIDIIIDTPTVSTVFLADGTYLNAYLASPYRTVETVDKIYLLGINEIYGESYNKEIPITTTRQLDYYKNNDVSLSNFSLVKKSSIIGWELRDYLCNKNNEDEDCNSYSDYYVSINGYLQNYNVSGGSGGGGDYIPAFRIGKQD